MHELAIVVETEGQNEIPITSIGINRSLKPPRNRRLKDIFHCYAHNRSKFGAENNNVNKYCNSNDNDSIENLKYIE